MRSITSLKGLSLAMNEIPPVMPASNSISISASLASSNKTSLSGTSSVTAIETNLVSPILGGRGAAKIFWRIHFYIIIAIKI